MEKETRREPERSGYFFSRLSRNADEMRLMMPPLPALSGPSLAGKRGSRTEALACIHKPHDLREKTGSDRQKQQQQQQLTSSCRGAGAAAATSRRRLPSLTRRLSSWHRDLPLHLLSLAP